MTGRCRKRPVIMVLAASRMLAVALMTLRRVAISSWIRTASGSLPSAINWTRSASVMRPTGRLVCASTSTRAVTPLRLIRYAAAATWSFRSTVVTAECIMSATWAEGGGGGTDGCCAEASVISAPFPGISTRSPGMLTMLHAMTGGGRTVFQRRLSSVISSRIAWASARSCASRKRRSAAGFPVWWWRSWPLSLEGRVRWDAYGSSLFPPPREESRGSAHAWVELRAPRPGESQHALRRPC